MASFTILLPCYNPPDYWQENVAKNLNAVKSKNLSHRFHLLIINDGSTKGLTEISRVENKEIKLIKLPVNRGKGFALRAGVRGAEKTDFYIYTDIDFPYTEESFQKIINELLIGKANVAVGVRDKKYYEDISRVRKIISRLLRWLIKKLFRLPITDTQCGLKGFDNKGKDVFLQTTINRYLFDLEFMFFSSTRKDIILQPVPVELRENIVLSKLKPGILIGEVGNFLKIFLKSLL